MSIRRTLEYKGYDGNWVMDINYDNSIVVKFNPHNDECEARERTYDIPEDIVGIEHDTEYVSLRLKDKRTYQCKFEIDGAFIGDIMDEKHEFVDSWACFSFYDD